MNCIIVKGRLTKDCELGRSEKGTTFCKFDLAVKREFPREGTDFFSVSSFSKVAEYIGKYGKKGTEVLVRGSMMNNPFEKNGQTFAHWQICAEAVEITSNKASVTGNNAPETAQNTDDMPF